MAGDKHPFESRGTSKHGSGIIPDADFLFSRARTLFRAARAALGAAERERHERAAHELEEQADQLEKLDRYGAAHGGSRPEARAATPGRPDDR